MEGLRFIRRRQVLLGAITLDMFAVLFGGAVALLPAIAEDRLDVGSVGYGWLRAAPGHRGRHRDGGRSPPDRCAGTSAGRCSWPSPCSAWRRSCSASPTATPLAFVALIVLAGADAVSVFIRATIVPLATPDDMRGRVMAVENVFIGASNELGAFESGVAGALLGVGPAVWSAACSPSASSACGGVVFPQLRDIDRFEDLEGAAEDTHPPPAGVVDSGRSSAGGASDVNR